MKVENFTPLIQALKARNGDALEAERILQQLLGSNEDDLYSIVLSGTLPNHHQADLVAKLTGLPLNNIQIHSMLTIRIRRLEDTLEHVIGYGIESVDHSEEGLKKHRGVKYDEYAEVYCDGETTSGQSLKLDEISEAISKFRSKNNYNTSLSKSIDLTVYLRDTSCLNIVVLPLQRFQSPDSSVKKLMESKKTIILNLLMVPQGCSTSILQSSTKFENGGERTLTCFFVPEDSNDRQPLLDKIRDFKRNLNLGGEINILFDVKGQDGASTGRGESLNKCEDWILDVFESLKIGYESFVEQIVDLHERLLLGNLQNLVAQSEICISRQKAILSELAAAPKTESELYESLRDRLDESRTILAKSRQGDCRFAIQEIKTTPDRSQEFDYNWTSSYQIRNAEKRRTESTSDTTLKFAWGSSQINSREYSEKGWKVVVEMIYLKQYRGNLSELAIFVWITPPASCELISPTSVSMTQTATGKYQTMAFRQLVSRVSGSSNSSTRESLWFQTCTRSSNTIQDICVTIPISDIRQEQSFLKFASSMETFRESIEAKFSEKQFFSSAIYNDLKILLYACQETNGQPPLWTSNRHWQFLHPFRAELFTMGHAFIEKVAQEASEWFLSALKPQFPSTTGSEVCLKWVVDMFCTSAQNEARDILLQEETMIHQGFYQNQLAKFVAQDLKNTPNRNLGTYTSTEKNGLNAEIQEQCIKLRATWVVFESEYIQLLHRVARFSFFSDRAENNLMKHASKNLKLRARDMLCPRESINDMVTALSENTKLLQHAVLKANKLLAIESGEMFGF